MSGPGGENCASRRRSGSGRNRHQLHVVDQRGKFLIEGLCEHPALSKQGPDICLQQIADGLKLAAAKAGVALADIVAVGLDTPGPASAVGRAQRPRLDQLRPSRLGRLRYPRRPRAQARQTRHLSQRWQRRRALGTLHHLRRQQPRDLDLSDHRHRPRRRRHRRRQCGERPQRLRRRARPRPDSVSEHRRNRRPRSAMQLRTHRRPGVVVLAHRHREVRSCPYFLPRYPGHELARLAICTRQPNWSAASPRKAIRCAGKSSACRLTPWVSSSTRW